MYANLFQKQLSFFPLLKTLYIFTVKPFHAQEANYHRVSDLVRQLQWLSDNAVLWLRAVILTIV